MRRPTTTVVWAATQPAAPRPEDPMTRLAPMSDASFADYRQRAIVDYADDNVRAGRWPAADALRRSEANFDELLPQGLATADHFLYDIFADCSTTPVGIIWLAAVTRDGLRGGYIYDVEIAPAWRRKGHTGRAFALIEDEARARGLRSIGLHVFGHNPGAQALYAKLGYAVTGVNMIRHLGA